MKILFDHTLLNIHNNRSSPYRVSHALKIISNTWYSWFSNLWQWFKLNTFEILAWIVSFQIIFMLAPYLLSHHNWYKRYNFFVRMEIGKTLLHNCFAPLQNTQISFGILNCLVNQTHVINSVGFHEISTNPRVESWMISRIKTLCFKFIYRNKSWSIFPEGSCLPM